MEILTWIDKGVNLVSKGLEFVRGLVTKVADKLPWEPTLTTTLLFLIVSLWVGVWIAKRFVVKPFQFPYILWVLLITVSIFLNLVYL